MRPLLNDCSALTFIFITELIERLYPHLVIGAAKDETENKILLRKTEDAIVDDKVNMVKSICIADGGMSIKTPYLITTVSK